MIPTREQVDAERERQLAFLKRHGSRRVHPDWEHSVYLPPLPPEDPPRLPFWKRVLLWLRGDA